MNPSISCHDVAVIGAGPAGCMAALELAGNGADVILLEKAALPRYKTCGGGLLGRAFQRLPVNVERAVERTFESVELNFLGTSRHFVVRRSPPLVHMTMRAQLDELLAQEAERAGAKLFSACPVRRMSMRDDFVLLATDDREYHAQFVIGADGVHSSVAKAGGWGELPARAPALEYEVHVPVEDFLRLGRRPRFDFDVIDAGYAWVFPKRNHLSVGILSTRPVSIDLRSRLEAYMDIVGISRMEKVEKHGWLIPIEPRREALARGRVLLAGDAAGLVDPVTAEGISHAIESGQLAAAALLQSDFQVTRAAAAYQSLLEKSILPELRAGRLIARILYGHPRWRDLAFRLSGQRVCEFVADVAMGARRYSDALRKPSSFMKLLGLMRHGKKRPAQADPA